MDDDYDYEKLINYKMVSMFLDIYLAKSLFSFPIELFTIYTAVVTIKYNI